MRCDGDLRRQRVLEIDKAEAPAPSIIIDHGADPIHRNWTEGRKNLIKILVSHIKGKATDVQCTGFWRWRSTGHKARLGQDPLQGADVVGFPLHLALAFALPFATAFA